MRSSSQKRARSLHTGLPLALCLLLAFPSCVRLPRQNLASDSKTASAVLLDGAEASQLVNVNAASREELERLPGIGPGLAARILAYRAQYGRFRRPEHLIMVPGISERRFRAMRALVTVE